VPRPKVNDYRTKSLSCSDFRGIAIRLIILKVFKHCILDRYECYFSCNDSSFGFKKGVACSHDAVYTVRNIVNHFVNGGSTVNVCALDLSRESIEVNHSVLYNKLMERRLPVKLLDLLVYWLDNCSSCVKWG